MNEDLSCPHGRPDCDCLDNAIAAAAQASGLSLTVITTTNTSAGFSSGLSVAGVAAGGCSTVFLPSFPDPSANVICAVHDVGENSIELRGDDIWGTCVTCGVGIKIPRVAGCLNFEKAGTFVGRAMILDGSDDDENGAELYAELTKLEEDTKKEIARYRRTLKLIEVARTIAKRQIIQRATGQAE